jgi:hypothetical protein
MKRCATCGESKPATDFYHHAATRDGLQPDCIACHKAKRDAWYQANKGEIASKWKARYASDKDAITAKTSQQRRARQLRQAGRTAEPEACEVCGSAASDARNGTFSNGSKTGPRRLSLDHNHTTGKIRGFLCHKCNAVLGLVDDSPELLMALAAYLISHEEIFANR